MWDDHYYGLPLDTNTRVQFYNTKLFQDAGIAAAPATFDDLERPSRRSSRPSVRDILATPRAAPALERPAVIWSFGGGITDDALTTATGTLNGPGTVAAVTRLKDWLDEGYLSRASSAAGSRPPSSSAPTGCDDPRGALDARIFKYQFPDLDYESATVPAGPGGSSSVVGGEDIVVFKATQNKEAALAFTRFMLSEEAQLAMGKIGQMPVLESLAGNAELPDYYPVFQEQLKTAKARTPVPAWPKIDEAVSNAVLNALRGDATVQAALDEAATQVDALLAGS